MTDLHASLSPNTLSRSLLVPGPQPPLSHLGATLMRHVVGTVIRYSLYQLGLPMPDGPPVRILRLRVFLDAAPLLATLRTEPAGPEVLAAMVFPRGGGDLDANAGRVRAAAALHRARLAALGPRRGRASSAAPPAPEVEAEPSDPGPPRTREQLWSAVCSLVAGRMPYLCDAALGELVTSLARRRLRHFGKPPGGALGQVALQVHQNRDADLRALGALDPMAPSWTEAAVAPEATRERARRARGDQALPARSGRRGGFREAYRWVLSEARPLMAELGNLGVEEGILDAPDDVFFLPFDLGAEFGASRRPSWLGAAVAANRREHQALSLEPEHDDEIEGPVALAALHDRSGDWDIAPLLLVE
jgi:hypothetical protein